VRQKIGRGSPNTVSPLLDVWFGTLAERLGLDGATTKEGAQVPEPVQQAATLLWDAALLSARQHAAQALEESRQALGAARADLESRAADLEHQKQALQARQIACDEALQMMRSQLSAGAVRLEETSILLKRRERDVDDLDEKLKVREQERDAGLRRIEEETLRHAQERAHLEARATANERRLLQELDREREEAKRARSARVEQERQAAAAHGRLEGLNLTLTAKLQEMAHEIKDVQQALALANARSSELSDLLQAQKLAHAATLKRLDLLLVNSPPKMRAQISMRRRRL